MKDVHILRDVLDEQLIDCEDNKLGRVDAILVELEPNSPPRVVELQLGFVPLARRFGKRAERWVEAWHRRWSVRRSARYTIPWSAVTDVHQQHLQVDLRQEETAAFDWERWLRKNVIGRIPGSGKNEQEES
jgi:hypothetical protein